VSINFFRRRIMIAKLAFGKTDHESTRTLFGGAAIKATFTQDQADKILGLLVEYGVNHIDTAASYGKGNSEACIGPWMGRHRDQFFLASKTWAGRERTATTWYEPLTEWEDISKAVSWLLSHEGIFLNTVGDAMILPKVLEAASHPGPRPSDREMERMVVGQEMELIFTEGGTIK
jgi:hypothetical protein